MNDTILRNPVTILSKSNLNDNTVLYGSGRSAALATDIEYLSATQRAQRLAQVGYANLNNIYQTASCTNATSSVATNGQMNFATIGGSPGKVVLTINRSGNVKTTTTISIYGRYASAELWINSDTDHKQVLSWGKRTGTLNCTFSITGTSTLTINAIIGTVVITNISFVETELWIIGGATTGTINLKDKYKTAKITWTATTPSVTSVAYFASFYVDGAWNTYPITNDSSFTCPAGQFSMISTQTLIFGYLDLTTGVMTTPTVNLPTITLTADDISIEDQKHNIISGRVIEELYRKARYVARSVNYLEWVNWAYTKACTWQQGTNWLPRGSVSIDKINEIIILTNRLNPNLTEISRINGSSEISSALITTIDERLNAI